MNFGEKCNKESFNEGEMMIEIVIRVKKYNWKNLFCWE